MGIMIVLAVIIAALIIISNYNDWDGGLVLGIGVAMVWTLVLLVSICNIIAGATNKSAWIAKSEAYQEVIDTMPSDTEKDYIYAEIIDWNTEIIGHQNIHKSFWLRYFTSPEWNNVPIVDLKLS